MNWGDMKTSPVLEVGNIYSRADLKGQFGIQDASVNNGIFKPKGHDSVWLFVTKEKTSDRTQYQDILDGERQIHSKINGVVLSSNQHHQYSPQLKTSFKEF